MPQLSRIGASLGASFSSAAASISSGPTFTNNGDGTGSIAVTLSPTCYCGVDFGTSSGVYTQSAFDYTTSPTLENTTAHTIPLPDAGAGGTLANGTYYARVWVNVPSTGYIGYVGSEFTFAIAPGTAAALTQAWTASSGSGASVALSDFTNAPTNAGVIVVCGLTDSFGRTMTVPTDNFGDTGGGSWTLIKNGGLAGLDSNLYAWFRKIGTGATGKTITLHPDSSVLCVGHKAEFGGLTGAVDGTATLATGSGANDPGAVITTVANGLVVGFASKTASLPTAGSGFTRQSTSTASNFSAVEDNTPYTSAAGSIDPAFAASAVNWVSIGFALK